MAIRGGSKTDKTGDNFRTFSTTIKAVAAAGATPKGTAGALAATKKIGLDVGRVCTGGSRVTV